MDFKNEDEAKAYFDEKIKDWAKISKLSKRKVEVDEREAADPYYKMMKEDKDISSRYSNIFDLDDEDYHAYYDQVEKSIGRYPEGFRHFENYENYRSVRPDSTLEDYHHESK